MSRVLVALLVVGLAVTAASANPGSWAGQVPVSAMTANAAASYNSPMNAINGNGLYADWSHANDPGAPPWGWWDQFWVGPMAAFPGYTAPSGQVCAMWYEVTFNQPTAIGEMWAWNYNSQADPHRGFQNTVINVSYDGTSYSTIYDYRNDDVWPDGDFVNPYYGFLAYDFNFALVKKIEISIPGLYAPVGGGYPGWPPTWGDGSVAGLSELAFETPEPVSMVFLGLGSLFLARRRK